jgi:hypothetical protein
MADENFSRTYGSSNERFGRTSPRPAAGNDPLAELARLIGQNDPFAEFGRTPVQQQAPQQASWAPQAAPSTVPGYEQGGRPEPQFQDQQAHHAFEEEPREPAYDPNYRDDGQYYYGDAQAQAGAEYDDVPPKRSRFGILMVACVVTLAVVGTAAAFGYRALFGSSGTKPPPVIQADASPAKVVPASKTEPSASKQFNDRVGERSAGERIVSREEQPIERPQPSAFPVPTIAQQAAAMPGATPMQSIAEPKRVRTIAIKPDGQPSEEPVVTRASAPAPTPRSAAPAPQRVASAPPAPAVASADAEPPVSATPPRPAPSRNAPLSLNPDQPAAAPARAATPPQRVASAPATVPAAPVSGGQYGVQVSSQRSEAEAQAAFRALQAKYPAQLGSHQPVIRRADLGEKGTYYRAMVAFSSGADALALCNSLKAAGGACIIQKN